MSKNRDYAAEYRRRIERGLSRGLSRPQARGHARAGERPKPASNTLIDPQDPEERALRLMKAGTSLRHASRSSGVGEDRLRRYVKENTKANRVGRKWHIVDQRVRQFPVYSRGRLASPRLDSQEASRAGQFMQAVSAFLPSGSASLLDPFRGEGVRDVNSKFHPFETNENTLYELDNSGELSFPEFYRIVA